MRRVLPAEPAVLVHLKPVRIVLLVLGIVIVSLLSLCACKNNLILTHKLSAPPYNTASLGIKYALAAGTKRKIQTQIFACNSSLNLIGRGFGCQFKGNKTKHLYAR